MQSIISSFQHLTEVHAPDTLNVPSLLADLLPLSIVHDEVISVFI